MDAEVSFADPHQLEAVTVEMQRVDVVAHDLGFQSISPTFMHFVHRFHRFHGERLAVQRH